MHRTVSREINGYAGSYPARLVNTVWQNEALSKSWLTDLTYITDRIFTVRRKLYEKMLELKTPGNWEYIVNQRGLFTYLKLSGNTLSSSFIEKQCEEMMAKKHVYLLHSGRACVAGLNNYNVDIVGKAIHEVVTNPQP